MSWSVAVNAEHDERAVLQHGRDVGTTPALGCRFDERLAFVRVGDDSGSRWNVRDEFLLQVNDDAGVRPDVVDPVRVRSDRGIPVMNNRPPSSCRKISIRRRRPVRRPVVVRSMT